MSQEVAAATAVPQAPASPTAKPAAQGLYDPRFEHDACGVGFVANIMASVLTHWLNKASKFSRTCRIAARPVMTRCSAMAQVS